MPEMVVMYVKLLTKKLLKQLPPIGATAEEPDPLVLCKFFYPDFGWTWYAIEYCPTSKIFFGFVDGDFAELGSFSLQELTDNCGIFGMPIERDRSFQPCRLSQLRAGLGR